MQSPTLPEPQEEFTSTYVLDDKHILIAVFNNKGGVAKTTVSINLAYAFAKTCNVLLTEADQQCNIQQFFTRQLRVSVGDDECEDEDDEEESDTEPEQLPAVRDSTTSVERDTTPSGQGESPRPFCMTRSAKVHATLPINEFLVADGSFLTNNLYDAVRNYLIGGQKQPPTCHQLPSLQGVAGNKVWFLPGSPNIIELETSLSMQDRDATGIGHHQLGAFRRMMIDTMTSLECRIAVIDFGPHSGLLNRGLITSCDLILPPCFADALSFSSSRSLLQAVLPAWFKWFTAFVNLPYNKTLKKKLPYILPFVITNFHTRSGKMFKTASAWASTLHLLPAKDEIVDKQRLNVDITAPLNRVKSSNTISICRHDEGLMGAAHNQGVPIIELRSGITKAQKKSVAATRADFFALAQLILDIADHKTKTKKRKRKRTMSTPVSAVSCIQELKNTLNFQN